MAHVKASAALLDRKFLASFTGKLFSNCNQAPTTNLVKAACTLWVRSNETSCNLACFILLQLGNILSNREGQNLGTKRAKGFRKLRARLYEMGTISNKWFSELRFWSNSSRCLSNSWRSGKAELQISRHQLETDTNQAAGNFNS